LLQRYLDGFKGLVNNTTRQKNKNKQLPSKAPDHCYNLPFKFDGIQTGLILDAHGRSIVQKLLDEHCSNPWDLDYVAADFREAAEYAFNRLGFEKEYDMISLWDMFKIMRAFMLTGVLE
jgi:hypothetical protein